MALSTLHERLALIEHIVARENEQTLGNFEEDLLREDLALMGGPQLEQLLRDS